jgi:FtsP/CotA-like multicopper oxidase with cupredoxin domain
MHGHDFLLLGSGNGIFSVARDFKSLKLNNPPRRDVATLPASDSGEPTGGWIVIGFPLDNPGIWMIHCHIAWHASEGLAMQFVERLDEIPGKVGVTDQWTGNCAAWENYQTTFKPFQEDSGI